MATNKTPLLDLDYNFLKQQGIQYIQELASSVWTDYNEHDPGITILEELCFAIIDLEYRTNFRIEDLLAKDPKAPEFEGQKNFYVAEEILPCNPLTQNDYLKIILDVDGVKNAKIYTSQAPKEIQGGYKILLDVEDRILSKGQAEQVIDKVRKKLYQYRNLCEDFFSIALLEPLYLHINAKLDVDEDINQETGEALIAEILFSIQSFIAPYVKFYSLREMLMGKGKKVDEVYTGPLLEQGFIDDDELNTSTIQQEIYISEILKKITGNKKVKSVNKFTVHLDGKEDISSKMAIKIPFERVLKVDVTKSNILLYHKGIPLRLDAKNVKRWTDEIINARIFKRPYLTEEEIGLRTGRFRNLAHYTSIQNDFPLIYGIGQEGLAKNATQERKNQAKQLKAYLLFFDQFFANYLAQLNHAKHIMAVQKGNNDDALSQVPQKVADFHELIKKPGIWGGVQNPDNDLQFKIQRKYLGGNWNKRSDKVEHKKASLETLYKDYLNKFLAISRDYTTQKNNILDHLLARFSENFASRALQLYNTCRRQCAEEFVADKTYFLEDYIEISRDRNKAIDINNLKNHGWDIDQVSGFERRLARSLAIRNFKRRFLFENLKNNFYLEQGFEQQSFELFLSENAQEKYDNLFIFKGNFPKIKDLAIKVGDKEKNYELIPTEDGSYEIRLFVDRESKKYIQLLNKAITINNFEQGMALIKQIASFFKTFNLQSEGFHLVEHIMLRTSNYLSGVYDPYSFMMTLVFPTWPARFQQAMFVDLLHEFIISESPAHIFVNVLWLDLVEMETFEKAYKEWLCLLANQAKNSAKLKEAAKHLLGLILLYAKNQD